MERVHNQSNEILNLGNEVHVMHFIQFNFCNPIYRNRTTNFENITEFTRLFSTSWTEVKDTQLKDINHLATEISKNNQSKFLI